MTKIAPATIRRAASVALDGITQDDDFWFRWGGIDAAHKADLASTIRNTGKALDPVLLWQPEAGGRLILLDGAHRLAAYRAVKWLGEIPTMVLVGADRRTALGAALKANSKRALGLSQAERMDAAWRLVRELVVPRFKVREIVAAADVSMRTVKYMRDRFRVMHEEGIEITGQWSRDRTSAEWTDDPAGTMTEALRKAEVEKLAADIRELFDRRKHPERLILMDGDAVEEAIFEALGDKRIKRMFGYYFGDPDEANEWLDHVRDGNSVDDDEVDDSKEPEPQF
ncbi:MAG: hypothetical protein LCH69_09080 [Proteobacteria bacterium]|nr:hypothetical protein [Pseudomonadota bacterium]